MEKRLNNLGLNQENSIVIGSGILEALGIRKSNDIDLVVLQDIFNALKRSDKFHIKIDRNREILTDSTFEIGINWIVLGKPHFLSDLLEHSSIITGVRYVSVEFLHKVKKSWAQQGSHRQKDLRDIELMESYLMHINQ